MHRDQREDHDDHKLCQQRQPDTRRYAAHGRGRHVAEIEQRPVVEQHAREQRPRRPARKRRAEFVKRRFGACRRLRTGRDQPLLAEHRAQRPGKHACRWIGFCFARGDAARGRRHRYVEGAAADQRRQRRALCRRQRIEHFHRIADPLRDAQRSRVQIDARALVQEDHQAQHLRGQQAGDQHDDHAAEQTVRPEPLHASARTGTART